MNEPADSEAEDLVVSAERFLDELGDVEWAALQSDPQRGEQISRQIRDRTLGAIDEPFRSEGDGCAYIEVSQDEMEVIGSFTPPARGGRPLELAEVESLLQSRGVVCGIDWEAVKQAILRCNTDQVSVTDVVVACGSPPVNQVPEHWVLEESLANKPQEPDLESLRVDFRMASPFVLVKRGEALAHLHPAQQGVPGVTVFGRALPYGTLKLKTMTPGENTVRRERRAVADRDGRFQHNSRSFWVNETLQLDSDVDYRTGNIDFPGDVIINGQIKDGFTVRSGGSVYCNTTMDASEVVCENDLVIRLGLLGRGKGTVKVGGTLRAKFIENCYVEASGSVQVEVGILNSAIQAGDKVELRGKGVIAGGSLHAQNGVTATQLGTQLGPKTEIRCGTNYRVEQKLQWIRDNSVQIAFKLKELERKMKAPAKGLGRTQQLEAKLRSALHKLNEAAAALVVQLHRNETAEVVVRDTVFPGVYIEICHVPYIVAHTMRNVSFTLDKASGKIVPEPLSIRQRIV